MHTAVEAATDHTLDINKSILYVIIRELLINPKAANDSVDRALAIFVLVQSESFSTDENLSHYRFSIKNTNIFNFFISTFALVASFRFMARQIASAREEISLGYLGGCNDAKVSSLVQVAAATCPQKLRNVLSTNWDFSVSFDSSAVERTSCSDIRLRIVLGTSLHCFHLLCLPLFGRHTGELMLDICQKEMNSLCSSCPIRLLLIWSDGARNMTGYVRGILSHIEERVEDKGCHLTRISCGSHQFNFVVRAAIS